MASFTKSLKNQAYLQTSVSMLLFFASWSIWWSFFQIWMENTLGFTGAQIGIVYSANSLGTLIIMFIYGVLQDRLGVKRHLAILIAVVSVLMGPFAIYVYEPLLLNSFWVGVVLGSIVISAGFVSGVGLLEALAERLSRRYGFEYVGFGGLRTVRVGGRVPLLDRSSPELLDGVGHGGPPAPRDVVLEDGSSAGRQRQ